MSRMRHTTLTKYLAEIRTFLKLAGRLGPGVLHMTSYRTLLETMTSDAMGYVESSGIDVDRDDVRYFIERFLIHVARKHARGSHLAGCATSLCIWASN